MMVHILIAAGENMRHDGAFFILSGYNAHIKTPLEIGFAKQIIRSIKPRRAPREAPTWHLCSFAESVIVGKTLPSEVPVFKAPIRKGGEVIYPRLTVQL